MAAPPSFAPTAAPRVALSTSAGDFVVELYVKEAPQTCHNFMELAKRGYYDGTKVRSGDGAGRRRRRRRRRRREERREFFKTFCLLRPGAEGLYFFFFSLWLPSPAPPPSPCILTSKLSPFLFLHLQTKNTKTVPPSHPSVDRWRR